MAIEIVLFRVFKFFVSPVFAFCSFTNKIAPTSLTQRREEHNQQHGFDCR